jgi:hypothetical protein
MARGFVSIRRSTAGPLEVAAIVAVTLGVWRLALGWDWAAPGDERDRGTLAQTPLDWLAFAVVAVLAVGWLALRGRGVLGFVVVCVPVVVLSGWRLAAGDVLDWPSQVAALVFGLSVTCMPAALVGWWLRRRVTTVAVARGLVRPRTVAGDDASDAAERDAERASKPAAEPDDDVDGATSGAADD